MKLKFLNKQNNKCVWLHAILYTRAIFFLTLEKLKLSEKQWVQAASTLWEQVALLSRCICIAQFHKASCKNPILHILHPWVEDRNAPPIVWSTWGTIPFEITESTLTLFCLTPWLCWPSLSAPWRKCGRPVLSYWFGPCGVFPLFLLSGGMMLEEQHSLLWDLFIFKTYFKAWKNRQPFLLKKSKFFILTKNIPRRSISMSRTPQYFWRFPFCLFFWQNRHTAAANRSLCQCICQLVWRKSPGTHGWAYDQTGNYSLLCNFIVVCDWLHIKRPLSHQLFKVKIVL